MPKQKSNVVVVFGSRSWGELEESLVKKSIRKRFERLPKDTAIRHGGAPGVDGWAGDIARKLGFKVEVVRPDYAKYGRYAAPRNRNTKMAKMKPVPYLGICFWDGDSGGTKHMIGECSKNGIRVEVHLLDDWTNEVDMDLSAGGTGRISITVDY